MHITDIEKAPAAVRAELQALESGGHAKMSDLSAETRDWLRAHVTEGGIAELIIRKYKEASGLLDAAVSGLEALDMVVPEATATKMSLDLYNNAAAYCRAYNARQDS